MSSNVKVFLSHSDKDKKIAAELKSKLSKHGLSVFLAHEDIDGGSDWVSKLYEEIQNSKIFIMLLTKNYHIFLIVQQFLQIQRMNQNFLILKLSYLNQKTWEQVPF